jgi:uncharacterized protein YdhG (YjbR/CyaY superfamily)
MKSRKASRGRTSKVARANKPKTPDGYLVAVNADKRAALETLRKSIKAAAPEAEECISYKLPAFRLDGRLLVAYGAAANHCAFYPGSVVETLKDELKDYDTSKGTIRFPADKPLPHALVRKLVKLRIAKNRGRLKITATPDHARKPTSKSRNRKYKLKSMLPLARSGLSRRSCAGGNVWRFKQVAEEKANQTIISLRVAQDSSAGSSLLRFAHSQRAGATTT